MFRKTHPTPVILVYFPIFGFRQKSKTLPNSFEFGRVDLFSIQMDNLFIFL